MKCSVFIAASLDGFIARPNGDLDWLPGSEGSGMEDEDHGYHEFMDTVDVVIMGRGTFDKVLTFGAWPFTKPVVVLSTRAIELPPKAQVEAMSGTPTEILNRLASRGWKHAYVDGGVTIQRFLEAGLIQRMIITRIPVLIGSGIPLFGPVTRDIRLQHVATRPYRSGLVQSEYSVTA
jgi:dihydrofolate reductase